MPEFYIETPLKYGFPFGPAESETCNYQNYACPFCQATDRERLYALYFRTYLETVKSNELKIIDFAPSAALSTFIRQQIAALPKQISYRTADYSGIDVDDKIDITDMGTYASDQFDFFICSHVLEHVTDDRKALRELYRILKANGRGILMVPIIIGLEQTDEDPTVTDEGERWRRFGQDDHVRVYAKQDFVSRIAESGFRLQQYGKDFFGEETFQRAGITSQSVLYVVEK